jgi:type IV secretion system protein VirB5
MVTPKNWRKVDMMTKLAQLPRDDDPYLAARQEYSDRYANLASGRRNWQFAALGFFLVAIMSLTISIIQVRQVKKLPYVVEADARTGYIITMPQPLTPSSTTISMDVIERGTVAEFIQDARSAIADFAGEDTLLQFVKSHARGPAQRFVGQYYEDGVHNPHKLARTHSVAVTIESLVPIGPHSYQVRFIESYRDKNGLSIDSEPDSHWVALVHTEIHPGDDVIRNPAGVYVVALQWAPEQIPEVNAQ